MLARYLAKNKSVQAGAGLRAARGKLPGMGGRSRPDFRAHGRLAQKIEAASITVKGEFEGLKENKGRNKQNLSAVLLSDEPEKIGPFIRELKKRFPGIKTVANPGGALPAGRLIAVVHSVPRAWKPPTERLKANIERVRGAGRRTLWVSFGNPYLAGDCEPIVVSISDSAFAQRHVAGILIYSSP
jgi:hypothetical protein